MTYPLSSEVVAGQATEAAQYNNLRADALYLGADPDSAGTIRDLLYSSYGSLPLSASGSQTILLTASDLNPAAVMIGGTVYSATSNKTLALDSALLPDPGRYSIYAVGDSSGSFSLALSGAGTYRVIGSFVWDGFGIIPGTVHNLQDSAVSSIANTPAAAHGRLTLVAGNPVPDSDITLGSTLYFIPYKGNRVGLYLFGQWEYFTLSAISINSTGLANEIPYDVFLSCDRNGLKLSLTAWVTVSARVPGTLAWVDGVRVDAADNAKRFLGTVVLNSSGYFEDSAAGRLLWNENNRVARPILSKLVTSKSAGSPHNNNWAPYFDEDAPYIRMVVPVSDCDFEITGVGISSPVSENDKDYGRHAAIGILRDPMTESPYTGNSSCAGVSTHNFGNSPVSVTADHYDSSFDGYHKYYLGFYSNYTFWPVGSQYAAACGSPGISGYILA